jgi:hypothetical protein
MHQVLILRANGLEGSAEFRNCSRLLLLDLTVCVSMCVCGSKLSLAMHAALLL